MSNTSISILRNQILEAALPYVDEEGWTWSAVEKAAKDCKIADGMESSIFPNGITDVVAHFHAYIDAQMIKNLEKVPTASLRSKDKIRAAILNRYKILEKHREAVKSSCAFWSLPSHVIQGQRVLWRTSDLIWNWAGDTATDYNRQTKRALLSSILMGTTMVWIGDESEDFMITQAFLDRRLENVMEFGRVIGTMKTVVPNLFRQANQKK